MKKSLKLIIRHKTGSCTYMPSLSLLPSVSMDSFQKMYEDYSNTSLSEMFRHMLN